MPFFSMVDRRKRMHLDMLEQLPRRYPELMKSFIPYASEVERMGIHRAPLSVYAARSVAGDAHERLWAEAKGRL